MNDRLIIDPNVVESLATPEQAANYIRERIEYVRDAIRRQPPPPTDELSGIDYLRWERRLMLLHGQALGCLMFAQAFGHISIPVFQLLKQEILAAMLRKTSDVQLGGSGR